MSSQLRSHIIKSFKLSGFSLRSEAANHLVHLLSPLDADEQDAWLDKVIDHVQKLALGSTIIDKQVIIEVSQDCAKIESGSSKECFIVIDAFSVPLLTYCAERKKFFEKSVKNEPSVILGQADDKIALYKNRYNLVLQRTMRNALFSPSLSAFNITKDRKKFELKTIEYLLGTSSKTGDIIVLGMLTQIKEGKYYLEDPTGYVVADLEETKFHDGLFLQNCYVLAEGYYNDDTYHVKAMGFPPIETAEITRAFFAQTNFFGGLSNLRFSNKMKHMESSRPNDMIVIVSDIWLDDSKVMEKLERLFSGFADMPPIAFILCGSFLTHPGSNQDYKELRDHFAKLADVISTFSSLSASKFVIVPSLNDPGLSHIFPRPPLLKCITESFEKKVPTATFTTNPCRIQYCTKEIVIFREDIVTKMCRNCVYFPTHGDIAYHFSKTIMSQSHLAPLPLHVCPVFWTYDSAMYLYPLPDLIVCADKFKPFSIHQDGCRVTNPGSFSKSDYTFQVYYPYSNQIEDSQVTGD